MSVAPLPANPKRRLKVVRFGDINPAPRKSPLVRDMLGKGEMSCLFGPPGCGKSVLAGDLAAHIAAAQGEWMGRDIDCGPVIYVAAERAQLVERRLAAWRSYHGFTSEQSAEVPLVVVSGVVDLRSNALDADEIIAIGREFRQRDGWWPSLVVVDTLSRALAGGDENSPKDMGAVVTALQRIQEGTHAHVMVVHHIPQDGSQRMRGHGALLGAVDTSILVEKGATVRTATVDKQNDGPEGESVGFTLESVELHREGTEITTAPVVVHSEGISRQPDAKRGRTPRAAQAAMSALTEALLEVGRVPPASNHVPAGTRVVSISQWRTYAYARGIAASDEPEAQRKAFQRSYNSLLAAGSVAAWGDLVWATE